ncbi:hypothetical protein ACLOJK_026158 [Asimina triloba]
MKGDTGPLVYPAGFLYVYSAIQFLTGGEVYPAQVLFGILYIINLGIILIIYMKTNLWCCVNQDECAPLCSATITSHVEGNEHSRGAIGLGRCSISAEVGIGPILGSLLTNHRMLDFNCRCTLYNLILSVNFKFLPEEIFVSKEFAIGLLVIHPMLLALFAHYKWCKLKSLAMPALQPSPGMSFGRCNQLSNGIKVAAKDLPTGKKSLRAYNQKLSYQKRKFGEEPKNTD